MNELTNRQKLIIQGKICPYCGKDTEFMDSSIVYGKSYGMIYICRTCNAYVGVHKGTDQALGRLANKQLRVLKHEAHEYFDKIWRFKLMKRTEEYTHIGMFSEKTCRQVIYVSKQLLQKYGIESKTPYCEND